MTAPWQGGEAGAARRSEMGRFPGARPRPLRSASLRSYPAQVPEARQPAEHLTCTRGRGRGPSRVPGNPPKFGSLHSHGGPGEGFALAWSHLGHDSEPGEDRLVSLPACCPGRARVGARTPRAAGRATRAESGSLVSMPGTPHVSCQLGQVIQQTGSVSTSAK